MLDVLLCPEDEVVSTVSLHDIKVPRLGQVLGPAPAVGPLG